ncbi:hypothetical protein HMPREF2808_05640 [Corynebacterium sp. HMSC078A10]|nr:hypothetical protein HMPREF2808_05640 [Corynebacterium sp. HMSC078A10]
MHAADNQGRNQRHTCNTKHNVFHALDGAIHDVFVHAPIHPERHDSLERLVITLKNSLSEVTDWITPELRSACRNGFHWVLHAFREVTVKLFERFEKGVFPIVRGKGLINLSINTPLGGVI